MHQLAELSTELTIATIDSSREDSTTITRQANYEVAIQQQKS